MDISIASIMKPQLRNQKRLTLYSIHHPMFVGNSPQPIASHWVFQRFGFADRGLGFKLTSYIS